MGKLKDLLIQCGNSFDDTFTIVDYSAEDRPLVFINEYFTKTTRYTQDEALGRNCRFLQGEGTDREVVSDLRSSIINGKSCYYDLINYKKNGTPFWNRLLLLPIHDEVLGVRYYVGIQSDITEKKEKELNVKLSEMISDNTQTNEVIHEIENSLDELITKYRSLQYFSDGSDHSEQKVKEIISEIQSTTRKIIEDVRSI